MMWEVFEDADCPSIANVATADYKDIETLMNRCVPQLTRKGMDVGVWNSASVCPRLCFWGQEQVPRSYLVYSQGLHTAAGQDGDGVRAIPAGQGEGVGVPGVSAPRQTVPSPGGSTSS